MMFFMLALIGFVWTAFMSAIVFVDNDITKTKKKHDLKMKKLDTDVARLHKGEFIGIPYGCKSGGVLMTDPTFAPIFFNLDQRKCHYCGSKFPASKQRCPQCGGNNESSH